MKVILTKNILPFIKDILPSNPIIIEAGAFVGTDTMRLADYWPQARIHAFEPVPEIFEKLEHNTKTYANIFRYQYALSDQNGFASFYCAHNPQKPNKLCQAGSLLKATGRLVLSPIKYEKTIQVKTITLDYWALINKIECIDFIWLDIQGHELSVLQNAKSILRNAKALLVEVHFINAYEKQAPFEEISTWLNLQGFTLEATDFTDKKSWFFGNALYIKRGSQE